jgi:hypothetical protein
VSTVWIGAPPIRNVRRGPRRRLFGRDGLDEIELDALKALELQLHQRERDWPSSLPETPLTVGRMRRLLATNGARRRGRKYAEDCINTLVCLGLLEDTGRCLRPSQDPDERGRKWWPLWIILPLAKNVNRAQESSEEQSPEDTSLENLSSEVSLSPPAPIAADSLSSDSGSCQVDTYEEFLDSIADQVLKIPFGPP